MMFSMLAMGEMVATFFILPQAWIHNLSQTESFLAVRDFQLSIQSCNWQFSGTVHFIVISTYVSSISTRVSCCLWLMYPSTGNYHQSKTWDYFTNFIC